MDADPQAVGKLRAQRALDRAKNRAFWHDIVNTVNEMFHINIGDFLTFLRNLVKWSILASAVGVLSGTASAIFLISLDWATRIRTANINIIFLLPVMGFIVGWIYHRFAGPAAQGNNLVIEELHSNKAQIPARMAPLVLFGTVITHLFGGSAGREGTAIQMGASLADTLRRLLNLDSADRRLMIMAGISGGFSSVFGTPVAGFVFGMEVQSIGRIRYEGIVPCLIAAYVGDMVTRAWGVTHSQYPAMPQVDIDLGLLLRVGLAGIAFGLTSIVFIELIHGIKYVLKKYIHWSPLYPVIGGLTIISLTLILNTTDYLGLSLPLIQQSVRGTGVVPDAFLLKLVFTAITLGTGFLGGEVTPLFVIGSTLGYTLGLLLGVNPAFMASIGFVAVFAGASNTPIACALMGIELFGSGSMLYLTFGCAMAYLASGHRGIYNTQRVDSPKVSGLEFQANESLKSLAERRATWNPLLPKTAAEPARRLVRTIMSQHPAFVLESTTLDELIDLALREGVRSLPVLNGQKQVVGMITDNDLRRIANLNVNLTLLRQITPDERAMLRQGIEKQQAKQFMTQPVITILYTAPLIQAINLLNANNLKRLPVVDGDNHLVGLLTRSDILRDIMFSKTDANLANSLIDWHSTLQDIELEAAPTVSQSENVFDVLQVLDANARKRVVVVDEKQHVVGIIVEIDLLNRARSGSRSAVLAALQKQPIDVSDRDKLSQTAAEVMTQPVITVESTIPAYQALKILMDNQIKRLPVVDAEKHLLGMVGRGDILRILLRHE